MMSDFENIDFDDLSDFRYVHPMMTRDPHFLALSPSARLLVLALRTGPSSLHPDVIALPLLERETGLTSDELRRALIEVLQADLLVSNPGEPWVLDHDPDAEPEASA